MHKTTSFESHRTLIKNLGESDATVEFTEVAIRAFIAQSNEAGDFNEYLSEQSKKYSIRVNHVEQNSFRQNISKGYIITVSQNMEQFFKGLQSDYQDLLGLDWGSLPKGVTRFDFILNKLKIHEVVSLDSMLISLFKYYSYIRNGYAHGGGRDHDEEYKAIGNLPAIRERYKLDAPNHFDNINFDDFILFTRASKDLAQNITEQIYEYIINNNIIVKYIDERGISKKFPKSESRGTKALEGYIKSKFGVSRDYAKHLVSLCASLA